MYTVQFVHMCSNELVAGVDDSRDMLYCVHHIIFTSIVHNLENIKEKEPLKFIKGVPLLLM